MPQRPVSSLKMAELKGAIKALNDAELFEEKLNLQGKKEDLAEVLKQAVETVKEAGREADLPEATSKMYAYITEDVPENQIVQKPKKGKKPQVTSERVLFVRDMVLAGKYTRKDIVEAFLQKWPDAAKSTVSTYLSDGKNPKYIRNIKPFPGLIQVGEGGILSFDSGNFGTPPDPAAAPEPPAAAPEPPAAAPEPPAAAPEPPAAAPEPPAGKATAPENKKSAKKKLAGKAA